MKSLSETWTDS